ncbi:hypothetical protein [Novosphingobium sp. JCM 18896]|uniref:hypothetical protein n=1 Tax=Novosphingobium sp. JCM 18896 TaxID=2989731 RepID=UPI0022234B58|nr:hypothetical protein [Novosphingobium sp. JCM 18896]MCW1430142.1 hypothetical protein [Novosphingobium sp. JCM 18896]
MGANIVHRLGGLLCLAIAAGFGWFLIWQPLQQAEAHVPTVEYSLKAFVLVPFAAVFGLFFLLVGNSVPYRNVEKQNLTPAGWILFAIAAAVSGLAFWYFKTRFAELGYMDGV